MGHTDAVTGNTYVLGPLLAFGMVGVLMFVLRWASRRGGSVVAPPARPGQPHEYGLLVEIAAPRTAAAAADVTTRLGAHGINATHTTTVAGPRVFVWPRDAARARDLLHESR